MWSVQAGIHVVSLFDSKVSKIIDIVDCCLKGLFVTSVFIIHKTDFQGRLKACQEELLMELHNHIDQVLPSLDCFLPLSLYHANPSG